MSNRKRKLKRQIKVPTKYDDHVVGVLSQKRKEVTGEFESDEGRVSDEEENGSIRKDAEESGEIVQEMDKRDKDMKSTEKENNIVDLETGENVAIGNEAMDNTKDDLCKSPASNGSNNSDTHVNDSTTVKNGDVSDKSASINSSESKQVSYVDKLNGNKVITDNKLFQIPTVTENGQEFVIFDEEIISEGSKKWELSACGYFVGYRMSMQELSFHLFKMWSKFGLKQILNNGNGTFVFKFNNAQGLQTVIESGPWIVNNKPMVVQKWDTGVNLDKTEPETLPIWIKLHNLPLEAWSAKGLSALSSKLGKPLIMDAMTTKMCNQGVGRIGFARVLVEVNANKGLDDFIEVLYKNKEESQQFVKKVKVVYDWKPPLCSHCKVFGHTFEHCTKRDRTGEKVENDKQDEEGFVQANNRRAKNENKRQQQAKVNVPKERYAGPQKVYKQVVKQTNNASKPTSVNEQNKTSQPNHREAWNVDKEVVQANRYAALGDQDEMNGKENVQKLSSKEKETVDEFASLQEEYDVEFPTIPTSQNQYTVLIEEYKRRPDLILLFNKEEEFVEKLVHNKRIPTIEETKIWPLRMFEDYKIRWEAKWNTKCPFIGNFHND